MNLSVININLIKLFCKKGNKFQKAFSRVGEKD